MAAKVNHSQVVRSFGNAGPRVPNAEEIPQVFFENLTGSHVEQNLASGSRCDDKINLTIDGRRDFLGRAEDRPSRGWNSATNVHAENVSRKQLVDPHPDPLPLGRGIQTRRGTETLAYRLTVRGALTV